MQRLPSATAPGACGRLHSRSGAGGSRTCPRRARRSRGAVLRGSSQEARLDAPRSSGAPPPERRPRLALAGAAASDLRALLAERGVGERLQRLVQVAQLVRDHGELLARLLPAVEARELLDPPVEPFEQRFELAVGELVHAYESSSARLRTTRAPGSRASNRSSAPGPVSSASIRREAPRWSTATRASSSGASLKTPIATPSLCSCRRAAVARALGRK